jgi:hypothetical protein
MGGISIATIGVILLLAGLVWLILAVIFDTSARRRSGTGPVVERERVVEPDGRVW